MLSYQHAYHAGNIADVHKHLALMLLLEGFAENSGAFSFYDSHAGRGIYDLSSPEAEKTGEHKMGVSAIDEPQNDKRAPARYLDLIETFRKEHGEHAYPGSPSIAHHFMRPGDKMFLTELHPTEHRVLEENFSAFKSVDIRKQDGFEMLSRLKYPHHLRGVALIDPAYEVKTDYRSVPRSLMKALGGWPNGVFVVWYPILPDERHKQMVRSLFSLGGNAVFESLLMAPDVADRRGLIGTGLMIFNAPQGFEEKLAVAMDEITTLMFGEGLGSHSIKKGPPVGSAALL